MPGRFGRLPSSTAVCLNEGNSTMMPIPSLGIKIFIFVRRRYLDEQSNADPCLAQWLGLGLTSWERCGRCGRRTEANKLPKDAKYNLNSCKLSEAPVSKKCKKEKCGDRFWFKFQAKNLRRLFELHYLLAHLAGDIQLTSKGSTAEARASFIEFCSCFYTFADFLRSFNHLEIEIIA
ncbi:predicted protein [Histoplasma capsulatum H143]|uniref:Uncharacterized protein n=1 Tax=Ajellomyces capsulatus (strain H143) TaxID=544712 RepID=C6HNL0_AJECH|nr:predicted protein [Histoplasma capsulatum H143]